MAHSGKTMTFATDLVPQEDNIYNLGKENLRWKIRGSLPLSDITGADDLKAIEVISGTTGLLKKTAANTWTLDTNTYLTTHRTYTAVSGKKPTGNQTPGFGSTFDIEQVGQDATGQVSVTERTVKIPDTAASTSAAGLVTTGAQTFAGGKTFKYTTRIYPRIGTTGEKSKWYKITFPYHDATTGSSAKWFMNSFDLHIGGGYSSNASGVAHVTFYWTRAANNGAWAIGQQAALIEGTLVNKIGLYYRIAEPGILYVNNTTNAYNGIWIDNLYVDDTSPSLDWSTITITNVADITESTSPKLSDYTKITTSYLYNDGGTLKTDSNFEGKYIKGTWLYTSAATAKTSTSKLATIESDNFIYYITPANALKSAIGTTQIGGTTTPIYWTGSAFSAGTALSGGAYKDILNNTSTGALGWNSAGATNANNLRLINVNTLAYWNGAYSGTSSNLSVLGTVTTGTWNASVIGAAYGGTGQNTLQKSANALINALDTGASDLTANDYVITQYVGGGTTTTSYHRRPASKVINATLVKAALGTVGTTAKKFLKDTGAWTQVAFSDLSGTATNAQLANSKVTIAGNDVSLGGSLSDSTLRESLGLSKALRFVGVTTTDMTGGTATNHSWTGTPAGISNYTPQQGDVVINSTKQDEWVCTSVSGTTYTWERLGSDTSYKIVQSAVSDPTASTATSTTFIDTISQNANGVITATKKTLPTASSTVAGITKVGASGGAAAYNHTHTISLTQTGTSTINLAANTVYTLTAGGNSVVFKTPADQNTDTKVTQAYSTTDAVYPILMTATAGNTSTASRGDTTAILNNSIYANPSTGQLNATSYKVDEAVMLQYNPGDSSLEFIFA